MRDEGEIIEGFLADAEAALAHGSLNKAATLYHGVLRLAPGHVGALRQLAAIEINGGSPATALDLFELARRSDPADPDLYHGIATALRLMGHAADAELALKAALKINPAHGPSLYDHAAALQQRGRHAEAGKIYFALAAQGDASFKTMFNYGVALYRMGNLLAAERWFHAAGQVDPTSAKPLINLGMIYRRWGFVKEAVACQEKAVELAPDSAEAHWNLANALLVSGDFTRGFAEYEWRFKRKGQAERPAGLALSMPRWQGEDLKDKTILVTLEQGLGDAIHFVRFAETLAGRGARVIVECVAALQSLLATASGVAATVLPGVPVPEAAFYVPLMSLPHVLGATLAGPPARTPYLYVPADAPRPHLASEGLRVGLVWRGNPAHENDRQRSMALELLAPLLDVAGVSFFSLQRGEAADALDFPPWRVRVTDLAPRLDDFAATAAVVDALDLVISVDTAVAHLGGALGKPTWVLIPQGNDWRWLHGRSDSPWYASLRLFRQERQGGWVPPVAAVRKALQQLVAQRG